MSQFLIALDQLLNTVVWIKDGAVERVAGRDQAQIEVGTIDGQTLA